MIYYFQEQDSYICSSMKKIIPRFLDDNDDPLFAGNIFSLCKSSVRELPLGVINTYEIPKSAIRGNSSQSFFREDYEGKGY